MMILELIETCQFEQSVGCGNGDYRRCDFENNAIQISEDGVMENDEKFENDMMEMLRDG